MGETLHTIGVVTLFEIGFLVVGTVLFAGRYQRAYGSLPDKDDLLVLFKIMLVISVIGGAFGYLLGKS